MTDQDIFYAKTTLQNKINSLRNDFQRAYFNLNEYGIQTSPFPIMMFSMSVVDFFSSLLNGWSEQNKRLKRFQTERIIDFCTNQLGYGLLESNVLVKIYRHSLMHTSDLRIRSDKKSNNTYAWQIMNINPSHMQIISYPSPNPTGKIQLLHVGIGNLIDDLEKYLNKEGGYFDLLCSDPEIQLNYQRCLQELDNQTI